MIDRKDPFSVLVVDDEEEFARMLSLALSRGGYKVRQASRAREAIDVLRGERFDFVVSDVRMPGMGGLDLLDQIQRESPSTTVVMMTAYGTHDIAIEAMKRGAYDYVSKPFKPEEMLLTLRKAEEREQLKRENQRLRECLGRETGLGAMVGKSRPIQAVFDLIRKIAPLRSTVLVTGESGTGKELVARALHELSTRANGPFVAINCAAIPENLLESELFGYARGAFTDAVRNKRGLIEEAGGGTLFLDEIGEMPQPLQVKMLRVLEEGEVRRVGDTKPVPVDARIIAASAKELESEARAGQFREDLFFRLSVFPIRVPPLRERREDIPHLVAAFISRMAPAAGRPGRTVSAAAMKLLIEHDWPGNVRELENAIERAVVLCEGAEIEPAHLPDSLAARAGAGPGARGAARNEGRELSIKKSTELLERDLIARALRRTGGNRTRAAELLEISHRALLYKIKEYGLDSEGRG
ncbi:MAG: sigma-54-dependent Fis family transcriptional regulator [Deltaproteobacteria bacterium]|nr:sigma-54-dependent Fis family transcriptional regulator [Deltaproteobacteria bacterium]